MSPDWTWEYDPSAEFVIGGLPPEAVSEVERIAASLAVLGRDTSHVGRGPAHGGGLRSIDLSGGRGFLLFMADPREQRIIIVRVIWHA
ncbi:hypothetical protein [Streptomyces sp. NPDC037389]|uniref:hypothetical protein n=1 Tax=Streptomyces sp. NPDC037389 TaxID=3155369 RepID=UPI0033F5B8B1